MAYTNINNSKAPSCSRKDHLPRRSEHSPIQRILDEFWWMKLLQIEGKYKNNIKLSKNSYFQTNFSSSSKLKFQ
jgi:hypothetical protein